MLFDISLPLALSFITLVVLLAYTRLTGKVKSLLGNREFTTRDVILLVVAMGVMVTVLGWTAINVPEMAIVVFFLYAYSTILFLFTYLIVPKWYFALLAPACFIALYFLWWNLYFLTLFAAIFAICASVYLGSLFTWKTTAVFVALLTLMDVVQVFVTGFMVEAGKVVGEQLLLPIVIILPSFPSSGLLALGLGDIFLTTLLVIQTTEKYGKRWGLVSLAAIGVVFFLLETIWLNSEVPALPATVLIIAGWLAALGIRYLYRSPALDVG
ncbi:MAG: hypothetical protein ACE5L6_05440 [Candidatus Bathyarchaeia archaeon]